jgi:hypothetical protein
VKVSDVFKRMYETQENALKVISLGWGVQSWTIAAMVALGELEPVDFAIHADTTHEASWTYTFAEKYTPWLEAHGVKVVTVKPDDARLVDDWGGVMIPAYTASKNGTGRMNRQCTGKWKIQPIRRYIQKVRNGRPVEMWIGITTDERQRAKKANVKYIQHRWPLLEKDISRHFCVDWLKKNGLEIPGRSSCTFCPYHDNEDWKVTVESEPDRQAAIKVDCAIRKVRPPNDLFIHRSLVPLAHFDLEDFYTPSELDGQMSFWDDECDGICGV